MTAKPIVHLAPFLQGGAGRAIASLACAQRRAGHAVIVATSRTAEPGFENYPEYLEAIEASGAALVQVDSLFKRDAELNARALTAIRTAIGATSPAVIHAHAAIPARIGMSLDAPVLQTMHGWSRNKTAEHVHEDLSIMGRADLVVFPSNASLQELIAAGGRFRRTAIVPYGIATDVAVTTTPLMTELDALRTRGKKVLVTIGSLTSQKNHTVLMEALPAITMHHDIVVVFVGEGPEMPALWQRAAALGVGSRVRFSGYLPEASAMLEIADLLVQPSLVESFGIAVIEAFRAGVPVVASQIPALKELVADTSCGWLFDPASAESLAAAVHDTLSLDDEARTTVVTRARRLFMDRFTSDRMIDGYAALYGGLTS